MHILSLVTDNNPFCIRGKEENERRNYFMVNLHESMGPGGDHSNLRPLDLQSDTLPIALDMRPGQHVFVLTARLCPDIDKDSRIKI